MQSRLKRTFFRKLIFFPKHPTKCTIMKSSYITEKQSKKVVNILFQCTLLRYYNITLVLVACSIGTFYNSTSQNCEFCSVGTYGNFTELTECTSCGQGKITLGVGYTASNNCVGMFLNNE